MTNINKTYDQIIDEKIDVDIEYYIHELIIKKHSEYYILVPIENAYKFNIRIKPFLTSQCRKGIANVIIDNLGSFVRVQTDGACFTKEIDYEKYDGLVPEVKTTGTIHWKNVNQAENKYGNVIIGRKD